eukprot:IDg15562t1
MCCTLAISIKNSTDWRPDDYQYTNTSAEVLAGSHAFLQSAPVFSHHLGDVADEVDHAVAVAPLVVIPRDKLAELAVEHDARLGVEHARHAVGDEVGRHHRLLGVVEDALEAVLGGGLERRLDVVVRSLRHQTHREIHDGHVRRRHAERHAGQLAVELRDHLADRLCGASRRRDDVGRRAAPAAPVLVRRAVDGLLRGGGRVHGGH